MSTGRPTALAATEYLLRSKRTRQVLETEARTAWKPSKAPRYGMRLKPVRQPTQVSRNEDLHIDIDQRAIEIEQDGLDRLKIERAARRMMMKEVEHERQCSMPEDAVATLMVLTSYAVPLILSAPVLKEPFRVTRSRTRRHEHGEKNWSGPVRLRRL